MPPIKKSWRDAGGTPCRQNHPKRGTPPAGAENLHFTLNAEMRRAPRLPVVHIQKAWEDADKVS
jgi:hypothetical protein